MAGFRPLFRPVVVLEFRGFTSFVILSPLPVCQISWIAAMGNSEPSKQELGTKPRSSAIATSALNQPITLQPLAFVLRGRVWLVNKVALKLPVILLLQSPKSMDYKYAL